MATWTSEELREEILLHLGVKPAGQSASAEDAETVDNAITSCIAMLRGLGLAPFPADEIPEWAWLAMRDYVSGYVGQSFGLGYTMKQGQYDAERELRRQTIVQKPNLRTKPDWF
jgi:hypothetical protein